MKIVNDAVVTDNTQKDKEQVSWGATLLAIPLFTGTIVFILLLMAAITRVLIRIVLS